MPKTQTTRTNRGKTTSIPRSNSKIAFVWGIIALALGIGALILWIFVGQLVVGSEFCPQNFQVRNFQYKRAPLLNVRISGTTFSASSTNLSTSVLKYIAAQPAPRWDVISVTQGTQSDIRAPQILMNILGNGKFWDEWSSKNPESAAVLWPIVQQAAIEEVYHVIPSLMETALKGHASDELSDLLTSQLNGAKRP